MKNKALDSVIDEALQLSEKIQIVHDTVEWLEREIDKACDDFDDLHNGFHDNLDMLEREKFSLNLTKRIRSLYRKNKCEAKYLDELEVQMESLDQRIMELARAEEEE
tara:strand:+ start:305 stop:625 length:321 start_codon:yes stop_codon:yes gene_type:complete